MRDAHDAIVAPAFLLVHGHLQSVNGELRCHRSTGPKDRIQLRVPPL
jgi:hypothetical protein